MVSTINQNKNVSYEIILVQKKCNFVHIEILHELLLGLNVDPGKIVELSDDKIMTLSVYLDSKKEAQSIYRKLNKFRLKNVKVSFQILKSEDWQNCWKNEFKPLRLTRKFDVIPAWLKGKPSKRRHKPIYIDTSVAFGTGMHETTRFMAQLIERCEGKFDSFFDIGTGTGILTIVALKCGARDTLSIDMCADAIEIARQNLEVNEYSPKNIKAIEIGKVKSKKKYDFVAANLITHVLIKHKKKILSFVKKDGYLAISGVSLENLFCLKKEFAQLPLRCLKIVKGKKWAAIFYKRID